MPRLWRFVYWLTVSTNTARAFQSCRVCSRVEGGTGLQRKQVVDSRHLSGLVSQAAGRYISPCAPTRWLGGSQEEIGPRMVSRIANEPVVRSAIDFLDQIPSA